MICILNLNDFDCCKLNVLWLIFYLVTKPKIRMIKNESRQPNNEPVCKKIQNYIFKFSDLLGQGNFSKVYKAHHEITSILTFT